jgi:hypothetical protein
MRMAWFLASGVIVSLCMISIERRLSTLEATFARSARMRDHDMNDFNHNWMQPVFARILALEGALKEVYEKKSLEERLRRHKNTVEHELRQHRDAISSEFKRLKEEIFMAYVDKRAHDMLRREMHKNHENLGKIAKWVQEVQDETKQMQREMSKIKEDAVHATGTNENMKFVGPQNKPPIKKTC